MTDPPFPYIVGVRRSGTTLLRAMLSSHPDLAIPEEAPFRIHMSANYGRYERPDGLDLEALLSGLCRHPHFEWFGLAQKEVRTVLREACPQSFSDAMRALFRHHARELGKTRYGDKTPGGVNVMPRLAQLFPEARFIHVIRDGRNVALSHANVETGIRSVGEVAVVWEHDVERGRRDGGMLGPERYREVRYEDLVDEPEGVLRSLCEFIELQFDRCMLQYFERSVEILGPQEDHPLHKSAYLPPTKGLRDWRQQMSGKDLEIFEAIAGDLLEKLGYDRAVPSVTPRMHRKARLVRAYVARKQKARRLVRRLRR